MVLGDVVYLLFQVISKNQNWNNKSIKSSEKKNWKLPYIVGELEIGDVVTGSSRIWMIVKKP